MRVGGLLMLVVAFAVGIVSAFVVAYFTLDAKPVAVADKGPMVKILVAKTPIAVGEEISAESVVFQDVAVRELPEGAITSFFQAYRRRPAYPIAPGCPICDDLLIPRNAEADETVKFIPAGSQLVLLEVEQIRLGRDIPNASIPITQVLTTEDSLDVHVVPKQEPKGELVERKNSILRAYAPKEVEQREEIGELVLENVRIHDVRSSGRAIDGKQYQTVSLLLENNQVDKLHLAAREGRLRIALHTEAVEEIAGETATEQLTAAAEPQSPVEPQPKTVRLIGAPIEEQPVAVAEPVVEEKELSPTKISRNLAFVTPKSSTSIKNEPMVVQSAATSKAIAVDRAPSKTAVVGLAYASEERPNTNYSPFDVKTRSAEDETSEPTVPKQLPQRQRFQWN